MFTQIRKLVLVLAAAASSPSFAATFICQTPTHTQINVWTSSITTPTFPPTTREAVTVMRRGEKFMGRPLVNSEALIVTSLANGLFVAERRGDGYFDLTLALPSRLEKYKGCGLVQPVPGSVVSN